MKAPRDQIEGYQLQEFLGAGNAASVYKAQKDQQTVAIKIRQISQSPYENLMYQRFYEGARLQWMCSHPNVAWLYQYYEDAELQAIMIEYLGGGSLSNRLKKFGALDLTELLKLGIYLADALNHLHEISMVHRDIKPDNLLFGNIAKVETVKLLDFDVAKHLYSSPPITENGTQIGTMWYMSPEQFSNQKADPLCDLYSLGVVLYEAASKKLPVKSVEQSSFFKKLLDQEPVPPLSSVVPHINPLYAWVIHQCMEYYPLHRVPSAATLATLLICIAQIENIQLDYDRTKQMLMRADQQWIAQHLNHVPKHYRNALDRVLNDLYSSINY